MKAGPAECLLLAQECLLHSSCLLSDPPAWRIADTTHTVFHYNGILSPPKSFDEWREFITAFGTARPPSGPPESTIQPGCFA